MAVKRPVPTWYQQNKKPTPPQTFGVIDAKKKPAAPVQPPVKPAPTPQGNTALPAATGMINSVKRWEDSPDQTVAGQFKNITSSGSPLIQMAETEGLQQANDRGLLNSSMAVGAAKDSVYRAALPIAQADAQHKSQIAGYNTDTYNKAAEYNATNAFNRQERIANNQYDYQKQTQNIYSGLMDSFNKQLASINQDPNMTQQAKDYAIYQLYSSHKAELSLLASVDKVPDVSKLLRDWTPPSKPTQDYRNYVPPKQSSGGGGGMSVLCTRLHELGRIDDRTYWADHVFGQLIEPDMLAWYQSWAIPIVRSMHGKTWISRLLIELMALFVLPWAHHIAYLMQARNDDNRFGRVILWAGLKLYGLSKRVTGALYGSH